MVILIVFLGALTALVGSFRALFRGEEGQVESVGYLFVPILAHASDEERMKDLVATEKFALWLAVGAFGGGLAYGILSMLGIA